MNHWERYELKFSKQTYDVCDRDATAHVFHVHGSVRLMGHEDDDDEGKSVGRFAASIVTQSDDRDPIDLCDELSQELLEMAEAVWNPADPWSFRENDWEHLGGNVLYLERLVLDEGHRGKGLGLAVIEALIRRLGSGCVLVVIKPYPLQDEDDPPLEAAALGAAQKRLSAYYASLGFKALATDSAYMARDTARRQPSASQAWTKVQKSHARKGPTS